MSVQLAEVVRQGYGYGPHLSGSSEVEGAEDDLPAEVDRIPELGVIETDGDHVLPDVLDVSCMGHDILHIAIGSTEQMI